MSYGEIRFNPEIILEKCSQLKSHLPVYNHLRFQKYIIESLNTGPKLASFFYKNKSSPMNEQSVAGAALKTTPKFRFENRQSKD